MKSTIIPHYRCTQSELYSIGDTAWDSFELHLPVFTSNRLFYNPAYLAAARAEIAVARALPDMDARDEVPGSLRIVLVQAGKNARDKWQLLKSYIVKAYPPKDVAKLKLSAAGDAYYEASVREDWEDLESMMDSGYNFMVANEGQLSAGNNMPPTFTADFTDAKNDFAIAYNDYKNADGLVAQKTDEKRIANNVVYDKYMEMFKDGQLYFKDQPTIRQLFVYENVLEMISSKGSAGLHGNIKNATDNTPIPGVTLSLFDGTGTLGDPHYTTTSGTDGGYDFGNIAGGNYTLQMEHAGFVTRIEEVEIESGVSSSMDFTMAVI